MAGTPELVSAYHELCEARPAYAKANAYYEGEAEEIFASDKVARMLAKSNLGEMDEVNFARIPVDAVVHRLHISSITTGNPDTDSEIADLIERNELEEEGPGLHTRACSQGDAYLMVWPDVGEDGEPSSVDMFVNSASVVRIIYDAENPLQKAFAIKSWTIGTAKDQTIRADLYYPDRIERWHWQGKWSGRQNKWLPYSGDEQQPVLPNPYGEVPFFHFRTARPYGRPEHYAAYGPQALINKLVMSHAATVDFQSLPQRYGLIDPAVDQSGTQSDWDPEFPEDAGGDPESPLNASQLRNDPGEVWLLQGLKGVGQFQAADPDVYLKPLDRYVKAMAQVTDTPMHIFDATGEQISGKSRREANGPLTEKVQARQRSFGGTWKAAWQFALKLLGYEDVTVDIQWAAAETVSDAEGWATVDAKIKAGVPREQALVEAGYDPAQVDAWLADLDDDGELQRRIELLGSLGTAVQSLGTAVQLGSISKEQVAVLLDVVVGAATQMSIPEVTE